MKKGSFALRLFLYASLFSLVWLGGYVALSGVFAVEEETPEPEVPEVTPMVSLPATSPTLWSVLVAVNEEREVTTFTVRYADFPADRLVFIEIPVDTKTELSSGAYEVLRVHNPELPELFMISELCTFFSEETLCMAAEEAAVSLLGVRPKVCYVLEESIYETLVEKTEKGVRFRTPDSVKETILWVTEHAITDGTLEEELVYVESYRDIDTVTYEKLPGTEEAVQYRPDYDGIYALVEQYRAGQWTGQTE